MTVHTNDRYIGHTIRNELEEGDEVFVYVDTEDQYYNREVTAIEERTDTDSSLERRVTLGDPEDDIHLVIETRIHEGDDPMESDAWENNAYRIGDNPDSPLDSVGMVQAIGVAGDNPMPDEYLPDIREEHPDEVKDPADFEDDLEQLREAKREIDYILRQTNQVLDGDITLSDYADRLTAMEIKKGGTLAIDDAF